MHLESGIIHDLRRVSNNDGHRRQLQSKWSNSDVIISIVATQILLIRWFVQLFVKTNI